MLVYPVIKIWYDLSKLDVTKNLQKQMKIIMYTSIFLGFSTQKAPSGQKCDLPIDTEETFCVRRGEIDVRACVRTSLRHARC